MGSRIQKRWPKNAEAARRQTLEAAGHIRRFIRKARADMHTNKYLAEMELADALTYVAVIERLMVEAKVGIDDQAEAQEE